MTAPQVEVTGFQQLGPFSFRWPHGEEDFEGGWTYVIAVDGETHGVRHGIGSRDVYGRPRVHTVTWLDGQVQVEGVEADDYPTTRALLSLLRHPDKRHVRALTEVPAGYEGFELVEHRREIDAKHSPFSTAAKIHEDDLASWGTHAWLRMRQRTTQTPSPTWPPKQPPAPVLPPSPTLERRRVAEELLAHGRALAAAIGGGTARFTPDDDANALLYQDAFAFLVGVICDQGIVAERAWAIPYELKQRLGHLEPGRIAADPAAVRAAFVAPTKLHRFVNNVADWVVQAGEIIETEYGGDASRIWAGKPSAAELRRRLDDFPGIGQKKAAMAVEILERIKHVQVAEMSGSDIAYDVHVRRVFLRTGLADRDDVDHMVAAARSIHPDRPGELDNPAWDIGRRWCRPREPDCPSCPLLRACPRFIERGDAVEGIGTKPLAAAGGLWRIDAGLATTRRGPRPTARVEYRASSGNTPRMAGKVERAVRAAVQPGEQLRTPTGRGSFSVARYTSDGLTLLLGASEAWTPLPWTALEEIPDLLRGKGWVLIGGTYSMDSTPGTLDSHLKGYLARVTTGWVAVLLERAGVVTLDRGRPGHIKLNPGW